jgi:hypothetical protein
VLAIIFMLVEIGVITAIVIGLGAGCGQYGPGVHHLSNGVTLTCS